MVLKTTDTQQGFAHIIVIIIVLIILVALGIVAWKAFYGNEKGKQATHSRTSPSTKQPTEFIWQQTENGWQSIKTPPACPDQPMATMPADIKKVTSVLYPGQTRGGNYKPHGGFRFDSTPNDKVAVRAPFDGFAVRGGSYLAEGEVQYTFDVMNNCGVMYRVGHLRVLPSDLQKLADTWPAPQEGDSRTQQINPAVYIKQGAPLATTVGIIHSKNTFFDWGVYDYRQENKVSKSAAYRQNHANEKELSWHAVCWFGWLPAKDEATLKSLPAGDPTSGKKSDYCK